MVKGGFTKATLFQTSEAAAADPELSLKVPCHCFVTRVIFWTILKLSAREEAKSHCLHLFGFSPLCDLVVGSRCVADWPKDPLFEAEKPFADEAPGSAGRVGVFYVGWGATTDVQRCNLHQKNRPEANKDEFLHNLALSHGQFSSIQWPIWPVN